MKWASGVAGVGGVGHEVASGLGGPPIEALGIGPELRRPPKRAPALGRRGARAAEPARVRGNRRLRSLLVVLEHEMRTPLATSLMQISVAEAAIGQAGSPEGAKVALASAAQQIRTLSLIVRRAIQLETEHRIDLFPQRVDLGEVVNDMMARLRATGASLWSRIQVKVAKALVGDWDPAAVEQILENLLTNALKFGRNAPVLLTVTPFKGGARLTVRDTGVGIDAKYRERIFGRFARAPSTRGIAGFGIGLWVVRNLIEAHGGRVLVRSRPGKWTVLDVWLPEITPRPTAPQAQA